MRLGIIEPMKINIICDYQQRSEWSRRFAFQKSMLCLSADPRFGNVYVNPQNISRDLGRPLDSLSMDLCEIAAYMFMADKSFPRGDYGKWTRNLSFLVPVRNPERWNSVKAILTNTVATLSGDNIEFHFVKKASEKAGKKDSLETQPEMQPRDLPDSDCVCLFSGGLDSFAGAVYLLKQGKRPLFASHYVSSLKSLQSKLIDGIEKDVGREIEHFQYRVTSRKTKHTRFPFKNEESSHRARSFLFLSYATVAAATRGVSDIYICENGVLSLNVPISDARKGTRSTRHAHPLFLQHFNQFINALYGRTFSVQNPFQFWTKGREAKLLEKTSLYPMIKDTVTCWGYPNQTLKYPDSNHCGYCIPCIVRRVSVKAAGLADYDDQYVVDVFNLNGNSKAKHLRNIEDLIYFCRSFVTLSNTELIYRYPELVMVEVGASDSQEDRISKIIAVYREFAKEVLDVADNNSSVLLPLTSLQPDLTSLETLKNRSLFDR
jgi:7-cyano-7-deazaguanine synthase in queuosine biosynthesis